MVLSSLIMCVFILSSFQPMIILIFLIAQTLIITALLFLNLANSWLSFLLVLVYLGGMLIMFLYVCSLAMNELILSWTHKIIISISLVSVVNYKSMLLLNQGDAPAKLFAMSLSSCSYNIYLMILYLLLMLMVIIKLTQLLKGPMKHK